MDTNLTNNHTAHTAHPTLPYTPVMFPITAVTYTFVPSTNRQSQWIHNHPHRPEEPSGSHMGVETAFMQTPTIQETHEMQEEPEMQNIQEIWLSDDETAVSGKGDMWVSFVPLSLSLFSSPLLSFSSSLSFHLALIHGCRYAFCLWSRMYLTHPNSLYLTRNSL